MTIHRWPLRGNAVSSLHRGEASSSTLPFERLGRATPNAALWRRPYSPPREAQGEYRRPPPQGRIARSRERAALASYSDYTEQRWRDLQAQPSRFETILRPIQTEARRPNGLLVAYPPPIGVQFYTDSVQFRAAGFCRWSRYRSFSDSRPRRRPLNSHGRDGHRIFCDGLENPMLAVYPLHLQKEIDRRWLLRSEETVCGRARLNGLSHFLREAAVAPKQGPPAA